VFLALINEYRRGVIDYNSFHAENKAENCATAFKISEEQLNIPSLIDPGTILSRSSRVSLFVLNCSCRFSRFLFIEIYIFWSSVDFSVLLIL
jgi:hypothetical protein